MKRIAAHKSLLQKIYYRLFKNTIFFNKKFKQIFTFITKDSVVIGRAKLSDVSIKSTAISCYHT